jgi:cytochrome c-type biogenesis protein CcmH
MMRSPTDTKWHMPAMIVLAFMLMLVLSPIDNCSMAQSVTLSAEQESQARELFKELHCMVCSGQSLADSDAQLAVDMRELIRSRIHAGESNDTIKDFLVSRYGEAILMEPPFNPVNIILWLAPFVLLVVGGLWIGRNLFAKPSTFSHPPHDE